MNTAMGNGRYLVATVKSEVRRAWAEGQHPDRIHLRAETGLPWNEIERLIALAAMELLTPPGDFSARRLGAAATTAGRRPERPRAPGSGQGAAPPRTLERRGEQ